MANPVPPLTPQPPAPVPAYRLFCIVTVLFSAFIVLLMLVVPHFAYRDLLVVVTAIVEAVWALWLLRSYA